MRANGRTSQMAAIIISQSSPESEVAFCNRTGSCTGRWKRLDAVDATATSDAASTSPKLALSRSRARASFTRELELDYLNSLFR